MSQLCFVVIDEHPPNNKNSDSNGKSRVETFLSTQFEGAIVKYYNILECEWHFPKIWGLEQQADDILQDLFKDETLALICDICY
ncbi:hypothetical protein MKX08_006021 [Trichoderma sp. CBMAI-0020]|nr:hypothetical protein MKX08_006021 [Trichoderma sp. CBMAI-0020]